MSDKKMPDEMYTKAGWYDMEIFYDFYVFVKGSLKCDYCIAWRMLLVGAFLGTVGSTLLFTLLLCGMN